MSTFGWIYAFTATLGVGWVVISATLSGLFGSDADAGMHGDPGHLDLGAHGGPDAGVDLGHGDALALADPGDGQGAHAGHGQSGFPFLSPYVLSTFLAGFGLSGYAAQAAGLPTLAHLGIAGGVGALTGGGVGWLLWKLTTSWSTSSEARVGRFAGARGTVTVSIPDGGLGEVAFLVDGSRRTASARTDDGRALPTGAEIVVRGVDGAAVLVKEDAAARIKRLATVASSDGAGGADGSQPSE